MIMKEVGYVDTTNGLYNVGAKQEGGISRWPKPFLRFALFLFMFHVRPTT